MRKVLLGSTALVAAGMLAGSGAPAQGAEPITLSLGGYYQAFLVFRAQSDVDNAGPGAGQVTIGNDEEIHHTDVQQEGEVHFTGQTTLDNGITVGVNIQLEAWGNTGDDIDEHYVFFDGNFGRLLIGAENSAPYLMHYSAPGAVPGHGLDSPNLFTMIGTSGNSAGAFGANGPASAPADTPANLASDANKITYFTPRFSPGFQFGFSYTPDTTDGGGRSGTGGSLLSDAEDVGQDNIIGFGVNFVRNFGDVDFAWSFGYEHGFVEGNGTAIQAAAADNATCAASNAQTSARLCINDPDNQQGRDIFTTGFQIGIGGWKVGGGFQYDDEGQEGSGTDIVNAAGAQYEGVVGVTYGAGPWVIGAQGAYSVDQDGVQSDSDQIAAGEVGGAYTLGPGVTIGAALQGWSGWGDDGNENFDGVAVTMGTALSF